MRRILILVICAVFVMSCERKVETYYDPAVNAPEVYKKKCPNDAFVFCLDTIQSTADFRSLNNKYCNDTIWKPAYLYLSSYKVYLPINLEDDCWCDQYRCSFNDLVLRVNESGHWLINNEVIHELNQNKMDGIVKSYYGVLKQRNWGKKARLVLDVDALENTIDKDSLYVSLLKGYYTFIKEERRKSTESITQLRKDYPFNLVLNRQALVVSMLE